MYRVASSRSFSSAELKKTALYNFHKDTMKARVVPFAGYHMPVSYPNGGVAEHLHCRKSVGLFDVSHMGQVRFRGKNAKDLLERVTVVDTSALAPGQASLSMLMLETGGIKDDCIITKLKDDDFYVVFNGACKYTDLEHIDAVKAAEFKGKDISIEYNEERSLVAIQGPKAQTLVERVLGFKPHHMSEQGFMECRLFSAKDTTLNQSLIVSRCGYTGEDGFEISVANGFAEEFVQRLLDQKEGSDALAQMVGLGARDSLRLEAGLCLYGHDLNENISPIEGALSWTISKRRKEQGGFLGYDILKKQIEQGVSRKRVGFIGEGKLPAREGAVLVTRDASRTKCGVVTSGAPGPSFGHNIGMAYVDSAQSKLKTELYALVRDKEIPVTISKMPFVPHNYYKKTADKK